MHRLLFVSLLFLLTGTCSAQYRWQVGADVLYLRPLYITQDPGMALRTRFDVPAFGGNLFVSYRIGLRGLFAESGIGFRPINAVYALRGGGTSGISNNPGVEVWNVPLILRQNITQFIPDWHQDFTLSARAGFMGQFVADRNVAAGALDNGQPGSSFYLSGRSSVTHHQSLGAYLGAELRFMITKDRLEGSIQTGYLFGFSEILRTDIIYTENGTPQQATVSNDGTGQMPVSIGLATNLTDRALPGLRRATHTVQLPSASPTLLLRSKQSFYG